MHTYVIGSCNFDACPYAHFCTKMKLKSLWKVSQQDRRRRSATRITKTSHVVFCRTAYHHFSFAGQSCPDTAATNTFGRVNEDISAEQFETLAPNRDPDHGACINLGTLL